MKVVGQSYPIHDSRAKATGHCDYVSDLEFKGMLHLAVKFSDIPHGIVTKINYDKALELEGVVDVIYYGNTTDKCYNRYQTQVNQGLILNERVFNQHVRFVGDRIAAVIAKTEEIARKAVKLIEVEYEEYPYALTTDEILTNDIPALYEEGNVHGDFHSESGVKPEGGIVVKGMSQIDRLDHCQMETHAAIANYNPYDGTLEVYAPTQAVFGVRTLLAEYLDLDFMKVRVVQTTMGGNFGSKQEWILEPLAAIASMHVGKPVRAVYNRHEDLMATVTRGPMKFKNEFTVSEDGKLLSAKMDATLDAGAYLGNSINYAMTLIAKTYRTYDFPHDDYTTRAVHTNTMCNGAFRGWTSPEHTTNFEIMMNLCAKKIGMDQLDFKLKNILKSGKVDPKNGVSMGDVQGEECLTRGRKVFAWDRKKLEAAEFNKTSKRYKRGIAVGVGGHVNGFYPKKPDYSRVDIRMTESGSFEVNVTVHDHGCGSITVMSMIAAEVLEISVDKVRVPNADTYVTPMDVGCFSSRTTYTNGRTVQNCANKMKDLIIERYSVMAECAIEDVVYKEGLLWNKNNVEKKTTLAELAVYSQTYIQKEMFTTIEYKNETNPGVIGAHFVQVEVDTYTGMVKVLDYLAVHDIGKAINREICIAQIQGACIMGIGSATTEHIRYRKNGVPFANLKDYHVCNAFEAPNVQVELVEAEKNEGPFGAKTIGEICFVPSQSAVAGAINDALDSNMYRLPLNPDRILKYLNEEEKQYENQI